MIITKHGNGCPFFRLNGTEQNFCWRSGLIFIGKIDCKNRSIFQGCQACFPFLVGWDGSCIIDRFPIYFHPFPDFLHAADCIGGQLSVRSGTNIQQVIAPFGDNIGQQVYDLTGWLIPVVRVV